MSECFKCGSFYIRDEGGVASDHVIFVYSGDSSPLYKLRQLPHSSFWNASNNCCPKWIFREEVLEKGSVFVELPPKEPSEIWRAPICPIALGWRIAKPVFCSYRLCERPSRQRRSDPLFWVVVDPRQHAVGYLSVHILFQLRGFCKYSKQIIDLFGKGPSLLWS